MQAAVSASAAGVTARRPWPAGRMSQLPPRQAGQRQGQRPVDPPHLGLIHLLHAGQHPLQRRPHPALIGRRGRCAQRRGDVVVQVGVPVEHQRARQEPGRVAAGGTERHGDGAEFPAAGHVEGHHRDAAPPRKLGQHPTGRPRPATIDHMVVVALEVFSPQQVNHLGTEQHSAARTHVGDDVAHPPPGGAAGGIPLLIGEVSAVVEDVAPLRLQSEDPVVCHVFFRPVRQTAVLSESRRHYARHRSMNGPSDSATRSTS